MSASRTPSTRTASSEWVIDPALESADAVESRESARARGSPTPRGSQASQASLASLARPSQSQNEKDDELVPMSQAEAGPSRPRRSQAERPGQPGRRRRRSGSRSDDDGGAGVIDPPPAKRPRTAAERQRSSAQGWETRRLNLWAERVLPTYSTGLETDYASLPGDYLLDSLSQHAGRYFRDRGLMKDPTRKSWLRRIQPNKKRALLEQRGAVAAAVARVRRESGVSAVPPSPLRGGAERDRARERGAGQGAPRESQDGALDEDADADGRGRVLRPRTGTPSDGTATEGAGRAEGSGSDTDASEDAYDPEKDADADADRVSDGEGRAAPDRTARSAQQQGAAHAARTAAAAAPSPPARGKRGPYIRRDMRNAVQGAGLLALGVLVEELIRDQLAKAGYAPRAPRTPRDRRASTAVESDVEPASDPEA